MTFRLIVKRDRIIKKFIRNLIPPALRFEIKERVHYFKEFFSRACFWRWEFIEISSQSNCYKSVRYVGRRSRREMVMLFLGIEGNAKVVNISESQSKNRVIVSEAPFPGAICIPNYLNTILPIDRSFEETLESIGKDKLKFYHKHRNDYHVRRVQDNVEIERLDKTMLSPYATERYGESAAHLALSDVKRMASVIGVLNLVYLNGKEVACHIGQEYARHGKRYWHGKRSGYPKEIFSNSKQLGEVNSMNYFLELEWLIQNGFDFYDIGISLARPNDPVLQWKRRLRGHLNKVGNYEYFYLCPPKNNAWDFFWDTPLFGIEKGKPTLHLGKPSLKSDEEFFKRMGQMKFNGLSIIYLYCEKQSSSEVMARFRSNYAEQQDPPTIKFI